MMVDRGTEVDAFAAALQAVDRRTGRLIVISGGIGTGRTTLLRHVHDVAVGTGALVLRATAAAAERDNRFAVAQQLFDPPLLAADPDTHARWFADLPEAVPATLSGEREPDPRDEDEVIRGLRTLLSRVGQGRTTVLLIDDLHLADEPSLRLFGHLARRLAGSRVLAVATVRAGDPGAERPLVRQVVDCAHRVLRPTPLTHSGIAMLVRELCGGPTEEEFVRVCHELTGGNPLVATSVLAAAGAAGLDSVAADADRLADLPVTTLRIRLDACLLRQPTTTLRYLQAISVLGEHTELAADLTGLDGVDVDEALRLLWAQGLLIDESRHRLVHPCLREAVRATLSAADLEDLHLRVAALLYQRGHPAEQVAAQLLAVASPPNQPWALQALRSAAATASRHGAQESAVRYLRQALLTTAPDGTDRAHVLLSLAAIERVTRPAAAVRHVLQAASLLSEPAERAAAIATIPPGLLGSAPAQVRELIDELSGQLGPPDQRTGAERRLALLLESRDRAVRDFGIAHLADSVARLRLLDIDAELGSAEGRQLLCVLLHGATVTNEVPAAYVERTASALLERQPAVAEHVHTAVPAAVLALAAADSVDQVTTWVRTAAEQAAVEHDRAAQAVIGFEQAVLLAVGRGHQADARAHVGAAVAELPDGWAESVLPFAVALAGAAVEADDLDLATQLVRPQVRDHPGLLAIRRIHQALQTLHDDQPALALDHLIDCGRQLDRMGWTNPALFPWRGWVATLRHRLGQTSAAITLAEEELEMARSWAAPTAVGRSLRVLGSITAGPAGVKLLREAVTAIAGSTNELQRARAHLALADGLGDHPEAAKHRQLAARLANLCGVPRLVRVVDQPADHLPARTAAVLTRSEQRVVRLAAEGWTNQAIADELGVSCRAVEKHLTSSYRKLGVRGRSGLTAV